MSKPAWSFSALTDFENCPHKYRLAKIDKVLAFVESEAMKDGNIAHQKLEDRVRLGARQAPLPEELKGAESLIQRMERGVADGRYSDLQPELEFVLTENMKPIAPWGQRAPKPFFMRGAWLRAKLDLVALSEDKSRAVAWDWKTGKFRPDNDQLELFAGVLFKYVPELEVVDTAFIYPRLKKAKQQVFFRSGTSAGDEKVSEKGEAQIWSGWLERYDRLLTAVDTNKFPQRPSGLCAWCSATPKQCPHSRLTS